MTFAVPRLVLLDCLLPRPLSRTVLSCFADIFSGSFVRGSCRPRRPSHGTVWQAHRGLRGRPHRAPGQGLYPQNSAAKQNPRRSYICLAHCTGLKVSSAPVRAHRSAASRTARARFHLVAPSRCPAIIAVVCTFLFLNPPPFADPSGAYAGRDR